MKTETAKAIQALLKALSPYLGHEKLPWSKWSKRATRGKPTNAAVLVPVVLTKTADASALFILEKRSSNLAHHAGQFAFPGGVAEPSDLTPADTALREAEEEVGLSRSDVMLAGALPDVLTPTGYRIIPVIGLLSKEPDGLAPQSHEVEEVFTLPANALTDPAALRLVQAVGKGVKLSGPGVMWEGRLIWGATMRILMAVVRKLLAARILSPPNVLGTGAQEPHHPIQPKAGNNVAVSRLCLSAWPQQYLRRVCW